jgi:hypothetical protein
MRKSILLVLFLALAVEASWFERIFGARKEPNRMGEVSKDLLDARDHAFSAWQEARMAVVDLSDAAWEAVVDTYESSWTKYREAKEKLFQTAESALETASKDYKLAKDAAIAAAKKVTDFLAKYKNKAEERLSDTFYSGLETVEEAASAAKNKLLSARDNVASMYERGYEEAVDDLNSAAQYLSDATDRLKKFTDSKSKDAKAKQTKKKLEEGRDRARLAYREAKKRTQQAKSKLDEFYSDVSKYVEDHYNAVKLRAEEDLEFFNRFKDDAKWKADAKYHNWLAKAEKMNDKLALNLKEAEDAVAAIKDKVSHWGADAVENIRQQYQNLKDEL